MPNTDEHNNSSNCRSPLFTDRNNGHNSTPNWYHRAFFLTIVKVASVASCAKNKRRCLRDSCPKSLFQSLHRGQQERKTRITAEPKGLEQTNRNNGCPTVPSDDTHFCCRLPHHFRVHVTKTGHDSLLALSLQLLFHSFVLSFTMVPAASISAEISLPHAPRPSTPQFIIRTLSNLSSSRLPPL